LPEPRCALFESERFDFFFESLSPLLRDEPRLEDRPFDELRFVVRPCEELRFEERPFDELRLDELRLEERPCEELRVVERPCEELRVEPTLPRRVRGLRLLLAPRLLLVLLRRDLDVEGRRVGVCLRVARPRGADTELPERRGLDLDRS
jgi:hypothetical protein